MLGSVCRAGAEDHRAGECVPGRGRGSPGHETYAATLLHLYRTTRHLPCWGEGGARAGRMRGQPAETTLARPCPLGPRRRSSPLHRAGLWLREPTPHRRAQGLQDPLVRVRATSARAAEASGPSMHTSTPIAPPAAGGTQGSTPRGWGWGWG